MTNERNVFRTIVFCVGLLLASPIISRAQLLPSKDDPRNDPRLQGWSDIGSPGVSDQARRLEEVLARYREIQARGGWKKLPTDLTMGPEYTYDCSRIAALERRLIIEGYLEHGSTPPPPPPGAKPAPRQKGQPVVVRPSQCRYTRDLTAALKAFQLDRKVLGYGQLGGKTLTEINRPVGEIISILENDVERWRRVPIDPSSSFILVNIPFFDLRVYEEGSEVLRMPVVVGKKDWQTPLLDEQLEYIILNPDWGIPEKIARQEYWPGAKRDPKYLARQGITVNGTSLRQKPGPRNPLGRIKFMMPNEHDVYLHDTPEKGAFRASVRALSHGCIRLSQPMDLAHYLLRDEPEWNPRRLEAAIATGRTQQINLRRRMPVHVVYATSRVNEDGRLEIRPDVYGRNRVRVHFDEEEPPQRPEYDKGP